MKKHSLSSPRIGVIGCGQWGKNLIRNFAELGVLAAVCDKTMSKAQELASLYRVNAYSREEFFTHPSLDALVIATPASSHTLDARAALAGGKHVYIEKPISLCLADARDLSSLALQHNKILMVGHILNYHPAFIALKERIEDLGSLKHIYANRLNPGRFRPQESVLWDLASHDVSLILSLAQSMPTDVQSVNQAYLAPHKPAAALLNLTFRSGLTAHVHASWVSPFREQKFVVIGDKGMAVFDDQKPWDTKLCIFKNYLTWQQESPVVAPPSMAENVVLSEIEPLKNECIHFLTCLQENRIPLTCVEEGVRVTEVLERAQCSFS